jgi:anti-anti-sigma factor
MSATTFMDSAGLRLLIEAYRAVGRIQEGVVLLAPSAAVRLPLTVAGCEGFFTIVDDEGPGPVTLDR